MLNAAQLELVKRYVGQDTSMAHIPLVNDVAYIVGDLEFYRNASNSGVIIVDDVEVPNVGNVNLWIDERHHLVIVSPDPDFKEQHVFWCLDVEDVYYGQD